MAPSDQGQAVACPHCGAAVAIPPAGNAARAAGADLSSDIEKERGAPPRGEVAEPSGHRDDRDPPVSPGVLPSGAGLAEPAAANGGQDRAEAFPEPLREVHEVRSLSRREREAFRRRVNLLVFAVSAAILAMAVACLLLWRG